MAHNSSWLQEAEEAAHREAETETERSPCGCERPPFHTDEEARLKDEMHQSGLDDIRAEESTITHWEGGRTIPREKCLGWTGCVHLEERVDKLDFMGSPFL